MENLRWTIYPDNQIKILGVRVQNNKQIHEIPENWESGIIKCKNIIKLWANRNVSIIGGITIAKTFLLPQFLYLMQATILGDETLKTRQSEMANTSPRHMPVLGNVHPIKIETF